MTIGSVKKYGVDNFLSSFTECTKKRKSFLNSIKWDAFHYM